MIPLGMSCSAVLTPLMTRVWPALWPPWKRTTPCAWSVSQSTILPLPSSPHWVPMTTTFFAMSGFLDEPFAGAAHEPALAAVLAGGAVGAGQLYDDGCATRAQGCDAPLQGGVVRGVRRRYAAPARVLRA